MFKYFYNFPNNESVYNLVTNPADKANSKGDEFKDANKARYRSIHSAKVREECVKSKAWPAKTMGVPRIPLEEPQDFLKKQSKRPLSVRHISLQGSFVPRTKSCQTDELTEDHHTHTPTNADNENEATGKQLKSEDTKISEKHKGDRLNERKISFQRPCLTNRKPPIPPANLGVNVVLEDNKDFIKSNALTAISMHPIKPKEPLYVDTPKGERREWTNSGLAPQYVHKKKFTNVPVYITVRKNEFLEALKKKQEEEESKASNAQVRMLDKEERDTMVEGLKKNWEQIFTFYQRLPLLIDTPGKIKRKTQMEAQLEKLETDIQTLLRHDCIYVSDIAPHSFYAFSAGTGVLAQKHKSLP